MRQMTLKEVQKDIHEVLSVTVGQCKGRIVMELMKKVCE